MAMTQEPSQQHLGVDDEGREWVRFPVKAQAMTREDEMERAWEERDQYMRSNVKLVAEIGQLKAGQLRTALAVMKEVTELRAENERLRAWAEEEQHGRHQAEEDRMHARSEVEQLKAGMREYACTATDHPCGCYEQFLSERVEIARLTAIVQQHEIWQASLVQQLVDKDAEVERLWAESEAFRGKLAEQCGQTLVARDTVERLKTTNESLEREMKIIRGAIGNPKDRAEIERLTVQVEAERSRGIYLSRRAGEAEGEVERLRAERKNCPPASKSEYVRRLEDEVEQLTADNADLQRELKDTLLGPTMVQNQRAEIERWKAEVQRLLKQVAELAFAAVDHTAEVERLTAESEAFRGKLAEQCGQTLVARGDVERLQAENERLKSLLRQPCDDAEFGMEP